MSGRRDFAGGKEESAYSPNQVATILHECGVEVLGETSNDFLCLCPFHGNTNSGSFSVSRTNGAYICFNNSCAETGTLIELVLKTSGRNQFEARRLILKSKTSSGESHVDIIRKAMDPNPEFKEFPQDKLNEMNLAFWENYDAVQYMTEERGFEEETLEYFKIGYSTSRQMLAVPMHTDKGIPVGVIGRPASTTNKSFKNSKGLPTSKSLYNIHRAKRAGDEVVITEASFDAMRVHQAGFPCVVACLGGHISPYHFEQLDKYFTSIIIMTDFDKKEKYMYENCKKCLKAGSRLCKGHNPGRDLGHTIAAGLPNKRIYWATYDTGIVYPHDAKDAGDQTDDEIRQCIKNKSSNFIYSTWKKY